MEQDEFFRLDNEDLYNEDEEEEIIFGTNDLPINQVTTSITPLVVSSVGYADALIDLVNEDYDITNRIGRLDEQAPLVKIAYKSDGNVELSSTKKSSSYNLLDLTPYESDYYTGFNNTVDIVDCIMVLHRMDDPYFRLNQMSDFLKVGGMLRIIDYDISSDKEGEEANNEIEDKVKMMIFISRVQDATVRDKVTNIYRPNLGDFTISQISVTNFLVDRGYSISMNLVSTERFLNTFEIRATKTEEIIE